MKFQYQKFPIDPSKAWVSRPVIPVYLASKSKKLESPYYALLDSGADRVIFPADLARAVGITNFKSGRFEPTTGISGQLDVYYHDLKLQVAGDIREINLEVGFADKLPTPLLGRSFFNKFEKVIFDEQSEEVELRP